MQTERIADSTTPHQAFAELKVLVAYADLDAGKCAMRLVASLEDGLSGSVQCQPCFWSFDLLGIPEWHEVSLREGVDADVLIVAATRGTALSAKVASWIEDVLSRKCGTTAAVVALFGGEGHPDEMDSPRMSELRSLARLADLDFFAPFSEPKSDRKHSSKSALSTARMKPAQNRPLNGQPQPIFAA